MIARPLAAIARHRQAFVDKETDEAARLCQRQRLTEQLHRLCPFRHAHGARPPGAPSP